MHIYLLYCMRFIRKKFQCKYIQMSLKRHICCEDNDENNMPGTRGICSWNRFHGTVSIRLEKKKVHASHFTMDRKWKVYWEYEISTIALELRFSSASPYFSTLAKGVFNKVQGWLSQSFQIASRAGHFEKARCSTTASYIHISGNKKLVSERLHPNLIKNGI